MLWSSMPLLKQMVSFEGVHRSCVSKHDHADAATANSAMIHESAIHDAQLNYMVSVKVTNESRPEQEEMEFQPVEGIPPDRFTHVYGDCFISDFLEGGDFQAVISIKVNDKSKLKEVKQAVDLQLSVPPVPGLDVGGRSHDDCYLVSTKEINSPYYSWREVWL